MNTTRHTTATVADAAGAARELWAAFVSVQALAECREMSMETHEQLCWLVSLSVKHAQALAEHLEALRDVPGQVGAAAGGGQ